AGRDGDPGGGRLDPAVPRVSVDGDRAIDEHEAELARIEHRDDAARERIGQRAREALARRGATARVGVVTDAGHVGLRRRLRARDASRAEHEPERGTSRHESAHRHHCCGSVDDGVPLVPLPACTRLLPNEATLVPARPVVFWEIITSERRTVESPCTPVPFAVARPWSMLISAVPSAHRPYIALPP